MKTILITGGAGFIGSHLVDKLVAAGHTVRILDNLDPQVHGQAQKMPAYLNENAEFLKGDVLSKEALKKALQGVEIVYHLAAAVGVGQSMYEIYHYTRANSLGGAQLLDVIINERFPIEKIIVASSMSIYGEGKYLCQDCGVFYPRLRPLSQLEANQWEMKCPHCHHDASPLPTDEQKPLQPNSIYAITKRDHEEMFLTTGESYQIPAVAMRFFNVYGPRQALSNPYTGVCAIFASRILNNQSPVIFEDGHQTRDFIHVSDITAALITAMEKSTADYKAFNVGTGQGISIRDIALQLIERLGKGNELSPQIVGKFRAGDIRHCFADITHLKSNLGFEPATTFEAGMNDLIAWAAEQKPVDNFDEAITELKKRGLTY
ncbi:SDR family NAD(P)-dependent oxidoreductase [candidate division CSSED10-310 bacterium]|uniref:SDR family NAD(P)-dependent oxidoreductase n=1 Tax=candidate division CSSED10-310 bacterium TaxID=2855610 RepID=A0ABV6YYG0_UNCC1